MSLTLGRPTYKGTSMRLDFIERSLSHLLYSGELFPVSMLAFETYARLIGADFLRIIKPENDKLVRYYTSKDGGFRIVSAKQGDPLYLVKKL